MLCLVYFARPDSWNIMHPLAPEGVCSNILNQQMWIVIELTCLKAIRNTPGLYILVEGACKKPTKLTLVKKRKTNRTSLAVSLHERSDTVT